MTRPHVRIRNHSTHVQFQQLGDGSGHPPGRHHPARWSLHLRSEWYIRAYHYGYYRTYHVLACYNTETTTVVVLCIHSVFTGDGTPSSPCRQKWNFQYIWRYFSSGAINEIPRTASILRTARRLANAGVRITRDTHLHH